MASISSCCCTDDMRDPYSPDRGRDQIGSRRDVLPQKEWPDPRARQFEGEAVRLNPWRSWFGVWGDTVTLLKAGKIAVSESSICRRGAPSLSLSIVPPRD